MLRVDISTVLQIKLLILLSENVELKEIIVALTGYRIYFASMDKFLWNSNESFIKGQSVIIYEK